MWGCPAHAVAAPALAGPGRIASHRIVSSCLSYAILAPYHPAHTHKTPRAMLLSLLALCAAPTPPQSAFTPPATQQALPATQPALSASQVPDHRSLAHVNTCCSELSAGS